MANLGGFAGGLASGIQSTQRMFMQKQELDDNRNFRERSMKIQETEEAAKEAERKREQDFRDKATALFNQSYGEQQVPDGEQQITNPDGTVTTQPKMKTVTFTPGQDPLRDLRHGINMGGLLMMNDPKGVAEHMKYVQTVADTQVGKDIMGAIAGDKEALIRLGQSQGFDGATATFGKDPKTGDPILITGPGKSINLKQIAAGLSVASAYNMQRQEAQDSQAKDKTEATIESLKSQGNLRKAQTEILIPAQARSADASSAQSYAAAKLSGTRASNIAAGGAGVDRKASAAIFKAAKTVAGAGQDGKTNVEATTAIHRIGSALYQRGGKKVSPESAASAGGDTYRKILAETEAWVAKQPKDAYKQRNFKSKDAYIKDAANKRILSEFPMEGVDASDDGADSADDNN